MRELSFMQSCCETPSSLNSFPKLRDYQIVDSRCPSYKVDLVDYCCRTKYQITSGYIIMEELGENLHDLFKMCDN